MDNSTPIKPIKLNEVKKFIRTKIKLKKSPGYDNINGKIVKELPLKALRLMTIIYNSVLRLQYFPTQWKMAQIIPIHKPGKDLVNSYRPISLLPIMSKICEKLLLERPLPEISKAKIIPEHQFGFRNQQTTIEQVNRVTRKIRNDLEEKRYCSAVFLDVSQAFDKVWHKGLLCKLKYLLPNNYYCILKSYLENRHFQVKVKNSITKLYDINAGVPQGSVLGPNLYIIYLLLTYPQQKQLLLLLTQMIQQ